MSSIALDPLSSDDAERLVRLLLTVDDLPASTHRKILERAEGNPFFLEEIVRRLIDGGLLVREDDRWRAASGIQDVEIPDTVQAVLASRIDLLEPDDKRSLQAASVVGRVFWSGPVVELTDVSAPDADGSLRRLEDRELVLSRPGSTLAGQHEYIFKHVLTRDVAYESLPRRDRIDAHGSVAAWLERTAGERTAEFAELLAYHYVTAAGLARETHGSAPDELRSSAMRWLLRASHDSLRRLGIRKAQRFAEQAMELAASDGERVDALEAMAEACFDAYEGDLAWRYFREAAQVLSRSEPDAGERIAYLAARACEVPQRWPGSIRGTPPDEAEATEVYELGRAALPPGDSEARIRLLGVRAGWPFGYPLSEDATEEDLRPFEAEGIEAADVALRMGRPDLASGALDAANAAWTSHGYYNLTFPLWERRAELLPILTDPLEIGDCYAMGAWSLFELGRYPEALRVADDGLDQIAGKGPNVELHVRSWRVAILHRMARWDEALAEHYLIRRLLDERRDDPPYFVGQATGASAMIHESRGDRVESDRLAGTLVRIASGSSRVQAFLLRLLAMRGDAAATHSFERPRNWRIHANDLYEAEAELLATVGTWHEAPQLVEAMRRHEARTGTTALVAFADRLEGRAAVAAGDAARAEASLRAAIERFDRLEATWERALTEVDLARAVASVDRQDEARAIIAPAVDTFEGLRAAKDLAVAHQVLDRT
ncbi:MAG: hypothetical protein E6G58_00815 [Actinobacteria bacterium]|nr:MAG: hypothetical protein E6G58_00815 [Actinomycetota bacterium]